MALIPIISGAASNSYADCQQIASKFFTTVSNGPVANILSTSGVAVSCPQISNGSCPGVFANGICTWQQKLAVTCMNSSTVRIRIQSNSLPRRCTVLPQNQVVAFAETNIDFEVNFNPDVSVNSPNYSPSTAAELNRIICNISTHINVPSASSYTRLPPSAPLSTLAGVAVDGVAIFNVNSQNQVDPFYPTGNFQTEGADSCLSHPGGGGEFHYHIASGCMISNSTNNVTGCTPQINCGNDVRGYSLRSFSTSRTLTVIGIGKDGHVIYGPYTSSGTQVTSGYDICNGMFYDSIGNYAYFATTTYPYITGCFGPGNYPTFTPNCTTNGPSSYTKSSFVTNTTNNMAVKGLLFASNVFLLFITYVFMIIL